MRIRRSAIGSRVHQVSIPCFKGRVAGPPTQLLMSGATLVFTGEASDPAGVWTVRYKLTDNVRQVAVPLTGTFVLVE